MKLEQQVVSLELAKKLKELGVKQEGALFVHLKTKHAKGIFFATGHIRSLLDEPGHEWCAAFSVAELGEMLPLYLKKDADRGISFSVETCGLHIYKAYDNSGWIVHYLHDSISAKTLTDAMAKMLIYLIENGLCPSPSKT